VLNKALYKPAFIIFIIFISIFFHLSCGLEDIPFIDYIPDSSMNDVSWARINLPSDSRYGYEPPPVGYFRRFEIYYRIYISGHPTTALINTSELRRDVNETLNSDFNFLDSFTDKSNSSVNPSNLNITFSNRKYFKLTLKNANIDDILNRTNSLDSIGKTLEIRFWQENAKEPELTINTAVYTLQRATSGPSIIFRPEPNRNFLNDSALYETTNAPNPANNWANDTNADVVIPNNNTPGSPRYTYVSMYIFAVGQDYLTTIYSQPTHIGIFRLAEAN